MCALKGERQTDGEKAISIYSISKGHGSPEMKKCCVTGRVSEELNCVTKREILRFKRSNIPLKKKKNKTYKRENIV